MADWTTRSSFRGKRWASWCASARRSSREWINAEGSAHFGRDRHRGQLPGGSSEQARCARGTVESIRLGASATTRMAPLLIGVSASGSTRQGGDQGEAVALEGRDARLLGVLGAGQKRGGEHRSELPVAAKPTGRAPSEREFPAHRAADGGEAVHRPVRARGEDQDLRGTVHRGRAPPATRPILPPPGGHRVRGREESQRSIDVLHPPADDHLRIRGGESDEPGGHTRRVRAHLSPGGEAAGVPGERILVRALVRCLGRGADRGAGDLGVLGAGGQEPGFQQQQRRRVQVEEAVEAPGGQDGHGGAGVQGPGSAARGPHEGQRCSVGCRGEGEQAGACEARPHRPLVVCGFDPAPARGECEQHEQEPGVWVPRVAQLRALLPCGAGQDEGQQSHPLKPCLSAALCNVDSHRPAG